MILRTIICGFLLFSNVNGILNGHNKNENGGMNEPTLVERHLKFSVDVPESFKHKHEHDNEKHSHVHNCIHDYVKHDKVISHQEYVSHPIEAKRQITKLKKQLIDNNNNNNNNNSNNNNDETDIYTDINMDEQMNQYRRRLGIESDEYESIRITPYWTQLETDIENDDDTLLYIKELVTTAIDFFEKALKVYPISDVLYVSPYCSLGYYVDDNTYFNCYAPSINDSRTCGHVDIPRQHLGSRWIYSSYQQQGTKFTVNSGGDGTGIADTDLVLYISANDTSCGTSTLAWATSCDVDQYGRPIAGTINFCQNSLDTKVWKQDMDVVIHELMHVLAMSSSLYDSFIDPSTGAVLDYDSIIQIIYNDNHETNYTYITTDSLKAVAKDHYSCDSVPGLPLEDDGGSGTVGSHWEHYHAAFEIMVGTIYSSDMKVSYFTFSLFEDSGWYKVNYNYTEPFFWGYNESCTFYNGTCIEDEISLFNEFFCDQTAYYGCSYENEQPASCFAYIYNDDIDETFQWFSDATFGGPESIQYCPFWDGYYSGPSDDFQGYCWDKRGNNESFYYTSEIGDFPIKYDLNSRCVTTNTTLTSLPYELTQLGLCFEHICYDYDSKYVTNLGNVFVKNTGQWNGVSIVIGDTMVNCSRTDVGTQKHVDGYDITVKCPEIDTVCYGQFPFACEYGYWNNDLNTCICSPGYTDDTCSTQTTSDVLSIADGVTLYTGTTESPLENATVCIQDSSFNISLNGKWTIPSTSYGIYTNYKKSSNNLWFDTWYHNWIISEDLGLTSGYYSGVIAGCDLGRFYVPDITDCNGNWQIYDESTDTWTYDYEMTLTIISSDDKCESDNAYNLYFTNSLFVFCIFITLNLIL